MRWHFIGGLQSNKAAAVTAYADVVHSVDRAKLVNGLSRGAQERGRDLDCLVQVSLDPPGADGRSGCDPDDVPALVTRIQEADGLELRGVMGVAPLGGDPGEAFARLAAIASDVRTQVPDGDLDLGRDERRPRRCRTSRCDTPADRLCGPRSEAGRQVMSEAPYPLARGGTDPVTQSATRAEESTT